MANSGVLRAHLTRVSSNRKTGPIPVSTTSNVTCPDACPLKSNGCYAAGGQLAIHWSAVSNGNRGLDWDSFCLQVEMLPRGQLWRHNQAGDLPGHNNHIDAAALQQLVRANKKASAHGFTYTHKPIDNANNRDAIKAANKAGFVINLSADSLEEADELAAAGIGPVVTILPKDTPDTLTTPQGRKVIVCPAQTKDRMICANCKLCAERDRTVIIGFQAHGSSAAKVEKVYNRKQIDEE